MNNLTPAVLSDVCVLLADIHAALILTRRPVSISVARVLAWAWNPGRLERCRQKLAEGEKAPPIHVNRYRLNGLTWYVVSDGRHRTVAAREAGRARITAVVGSETDCHPDRYRLAVNDGRLWQAMAEPGCFQLVAADLEPSVMAGLLAVGVALM